MGEFIHNAALVLGGALALWVGSNLVFSAYFFQKRIHLYKVLSYSNRGKHGQAG